MAVPGQKIQNLNSVRSGNDSEIVNEYAIEKEMQDKEELKKEDDLPISVPSISSIDFFDMLPPSLSTCKEMIERRLPPPKEEVVFPEVEEELEMAERTFPPQKEVVVPEIVNEVAPIPTEAKPVEIAKVEELATLNSFGETLSEEGKRSERRIQRRQ